MQGPVLVAIIVLLIVAIISQEYWTRTAALLVAIGMLLLGHGEIK